MSDSAADKRLGQAIRAERRAQGLTQAQLAAKVGYEPRSGGVTISRIENGVISPPVSRLTRIAEALNTTPEDLYDNAGLSTMPATLLRLAALDEHVRSKSVRQRANGLLESDIATESQLLDTRTQEVLAQLTSAHDRVRDEFLLPFLSCVARIQGVDEQRADDATTAADTPEQRTLNLQREELKRELLRATGVGFVATAGTVAAYGAFAATAARASASTGAAIAALSGGEASSVTLATLGASTLATGALGASTGGALFALTAPYALILTQVAPQLGWRRRERNRNAELTAMQQKQTQLSEDLEQFWGWAARAGIIFDQIRRQAARPLVRLEMGVERLTEDESLPEPLPFERFSSREQDSLEMLLEMASLELVVSSLPLVQHLNLSDHDSQIRADIVAWNELVLADAEHRLHLPSLDQETGTT